MKRYFAESIENNIATICGKEHEHLSRVMRTKVNDEIIVNFKGHTYEGTVVGINSKETKVNILREINNGSETDINITAYCALIKGDHMSYMIQKLTELGVKTFVPIETKYTVVKDMGNKTSRLQTIAEQAIKQCGRNTPMQITKTRELSDILGDFKEYDQVLFANTSESSVRISDIIGNFKNIAFIIGPEGGFSPDEIDSIISYGAKSVTLGNRILRADTAAIVTTTLILSTCGEI